ncbi:MAG: cyclophilin-like fold protein [Promethearchaeota archaeon]
MTKKIKIILKRAKIELKGELYETPTGNAVWEILPIRSEVNTWGEEIYFGISLEHPLEPEARANVEIGEIGYWNVGCSFCVFFGATPVSSGEKPVAASPVNIFGKVIDDAKMLRNVRDGDEVIVEKLE